MRIDQLFSLRERVAIITGGGRGLGKFIAGGLAEAGADVVLASRKIDNCVEAAKEIESLGVKALPVQCDLAKEEDIKNLEKATMKSFGRIDILVNNAGMTWGAPTLEYPMDKWEKVINVNLRGVFLLSRNVANIMVKQNRGKIINISSVLGSRGTTEEIGPAIAYNASKGAINALTLDLAVKLARFNINVNGIAPGYFDTDMIGYTKQDSVVLEKLIGKIPAGRLGLEDDIKGAAVFLASDASKYLYGHILSVDGGYLTM
ncbi:glucose 1-dehydrogenase [Desulfosarcina ovata]|uniref:Gluconate 5-dehydrogenase n=1 Tax=Desulfosarcina ovata subsp. ovata TaxID=2752305 RepID=A0A5K8A7P9_9BACT|nr:glucose 1-dehydrogenase [Desulfosarcina ovata]BBO88090.1 gluconate 5-dehydrogenase [Desulfosarcina ovata subsp. ovata]